MMQFSSCDRERRWPYSWFWLVSLFNLPFSPEQAPFWICCIFFPFLVLSVQGLSIISRLHVMCATQKAVNVIVVLGDKRDREQETKERWHR